MKKLYLVKLRGLGSSMGVNYKESYVVAENTEKAYDMVREYLNTNNLGFDHERELLSITLLAESGPYPDCKTLLFV